MTDLEMTKLCAEAIGVQVGLYTNGQGFYDKDTVEDYDPLHDDDQCMALVKHLTLDITYLCGSLKWQVSHFPASQSPGSDYDLNRAIVEYVARMQAGKKAAS
jgi:hypothetical protein